MDKKYLLSNISLNLDSSLIRLNIDSILNNNKSNVSKSMKRRTKKNIPKGLKEQVWKKYNGDYLNYEIFST